MKPEKNKSVKKNNVRFKALSVVFAVFIWEIVAIIVDNKILVAGPGEVFVSLIKIVTEAGFLKTILFSFKRIVEGFMIAFGLGIVLSVIAARYKFVEILLWPYVTLIKTVPVASFIIISLIWLSGEKLATFISFLMVFPLIYSNVLNGIKSVDSNLVEMAKVFGVSWVKRIIYIYAPGVKSYLVSACSVALGTAWKAGIAAEVIGIVKNSIGEKLYESKIYFMISELFAWTVVIVVLSVLFEKLFLALLNFLYKELCKL